MKKCSIPSYIFLALLAGVAIFPVLFVISNSFMSSAEIISRYSAEILPANEADFASRGVHFVRVGLLPERFDLGQYRELFLKSPGYLRMFWNSVAIVIPVLLGQTILAPLTAYGFERVMWKHKEALFLVYIVIMLMPAQLLLVPNFVVAGWLHIRDNVLAIILPAVFHPLGVVLIRQQLKNFPTSCIEAAALDGAGEYQTYRLIVRPNLSSVVAALTVLLFADNWNIVDQAVVFIRKTYENPLSVYLANVVSEAPGIFFAVSGFYLIPALLVFFLGQDHLIEGVVLSELKV